MGVENRNDEILRILILFKSYKDEDGDGVEVTSDPIKNIEAIKLLTDGSFLTTAVISNAIEIVAHNSEAAIYVVNKYGDPALQTMLESYADKLEMVNKNDVDTNMLNEMLKYQKGKQH